MTNLHSTTVIIERKLELARNTFQTSIDASLTDYSRGLDRLMKKFAIIATIFLPLQLISGIWGMN
jgi:Mg2+ and Co2+ transporter CorA